MSRIITPVHIAPVCGHPVRFFRSPRAGPDLPWHAVEDLYAAARLPGELRRRMMRMTRSFEGGVDSVTIATTEGPLVIGAHSLAQGFIGALQEIDLLPDGFGQQYTRAGAQTLGVLTASLSLEEVVAFVSAAAKKAGSPEIGGAA